MNDIKMPAKDKLRDIINNPINPVIIINLVLAVTALLRDIVTAAYLGTSYYADALLLALFLPDYVANNLLAAAMGVACVPVLSRLYLRTAQAEEDRFYLLVHKVLIVVFLLAALLMAAFIGFRTEIVAVLGKGFSAEASSLCVTIMLILAPTVVFFPLVSLGAAILQVFQRFNIAAFAPVSYNLVILVVVILLFTVGVPLQQGIYPLSITYSVAVFVMVLLIWGFLAKQYPQIWLSAGRTSVSNNNSDIQAIIKVFFPYALILLAAQTVFFLERYLASQLGEGSIAALNYAYRLAQFPIWVFIAALSVVILPALSRYVGSGQVQEFRASLNKSLQWVLIVSLPLTIILFVLRYPIISILLQRGAFDTFSLNLTASVLAGYALAVLGQSLVYLGLRVFLALGRLRYPLFCVVISSSLTLILDWLLVGVWGLYGLGFGTAVGATVNGLLFIILLERQVGLDFQNQLGQYGKIAAANFPVLTLAWISVRCWHFLQPASGLAQFSYVAAVAGGIILVYLLCLHYFRLLKNLF